MGRTVAESCAARSAAISRACSSLVAARAEPSSSSAARCACPAIHTRQRHMHCHGHPRDLSTPRFLVTQPATLLCDFKMWKSTPDEPIPTIAGHDSLMSHKVFSRSFCNSQSPHKSVNLFFI